jgi:hypothetical protein
MKQALKESKNFSYVYKLLLIGRMELANKHLSRVSNICHARFIRIYFIIKILLGSHSFFSCVVYRYDDYILCCLYDRYDYGFPFGDVYGVRAKRGDVAYSLCHTSSKHKTPTTQQVRVFSSYKGTKNYVVNCQLLIVNCQLLLTQLLFVHIVCVCNDCRFS